MIGLYVPGRSPLHRLPASAKLAALAVTGIVIFLIDTPWLLAAAAGLSAVLLASTGVSTRQTAHQLRGVMLFLLIIFAAHGLFTSWLLGTVVLLRFLSLILLALAITTTTKVGDMTETLERALTPLSALGVDPAKVSLAISLAIRFIPVLALQAREILDAQRARGLERNVVALAVPLVIRTLRLADRLTEAIEARGWDPACDPATATAKTDKCPQKLWRCGPLRLLWWWGRHR